MNNRRTDRRRRRSRRKKRAEISRSRFRIGINKRTVFLLAVLVIAIFGFALLRNLYFFITESGADEDNRYSVKGVDVSAYQKEIDWKGLESQDIRFAFIKATEGSTHVDKKFEYNWKEAHKTDMKVGAYHFMSYDSRAEDQAENFIEHVDKRMGMLPPVVDVEFYGEYVKKHPSVGKLRNILDIILEKLEDRYNRKPIIYTNSYIYKTYISGHYDDYPIWISDHSIPDKLPDGREWVFCQYTFRATSKYVAEGKKYVDMNVFNGSKWEFRKYNGK